MFLDLKQNEINIVAFDLFGSHLCDSSYFITFISTYDYKKNKIFTGNFIYTGRTNILEIELVDENNEDIMNSRIFLEPGQYFYNVYETTETIDEQYLIDFLEQKVSEDIYTTDPQNAIEVDRLIVR
jgi:hypothetical protein